MTGALPGPYAARTVASRCGCGRGTMRTRSPRGSPQRVVDKVYDSAALALARGCVCSGCATAGGGARVGDTVGHVLRAL